MPAPPVHFDVQPVREAFLAADFTVDGVAGRLGPEATAALERYETVPARRATGSGDALDTLIRLFLLQLPVPAEHAAHALPADPASRLGLVGQEGDQTRAALDLRPYAEDGGPLWWVLSDLGTGLDGRHQPLPADHVLGIGGASTTLAQLTPRRKVGIVLDVGTGCGVQALHASRHSDQVVATDLSPRALRLATITAALSGVRLDLREGDLLEPVVGESFDLVVSNPPFVVGAPAGDTRHTYRDGGLPLDGISARMAAEAPGLLNPGGTLVMLGNWVQVGGQDWAERVADWLPAHGVDALVVQREVLDLAAYVGTWLSDAGERGSEAYVRKYDEWLDSLQQHQIEAIGFGFVVVRRSDEPRRVTTLDWPHAVETPLAPHVDGWLDRQRWLATRTDDRVLATMTLTLADDVVQEQVGHPGDEDPEHVVLRQQVGLRRAFAVDSATAGLVGACDGSLPVGALVAAVRQVLDLDDSATEALLGQVRLMVEAGLLQPRDLHTP